MSEIDWTPFDKSPEDAATCQCGKHYWTHAKADMQQCKLIARKPCPKCGQVLLRGARSDSDKFTL